MADLSFDLLDDVLQRTHPDKHQSFIREASSDR